MDGEKTRGADARKVRRLLKPALLDRRLSLTPPISVDSLSYADTHQAISLNAHCLLDLNHPRLASTCFASQETGSKTNEMTGSHRQGPLDPLSGVKAAEHPLSIRSLYVLLVVLLSAWVLGAALRLSSELAG